MRRSPHREAEVDIAAEAGEEVEAMLEDEVNREMKTKTINPLTNPQSNATIVNGLEILHMSVEMQRSHEKIEPMWRKLPRQRQRQQLRQVLPTQWSRRLLFSWR